jgi:osmotically-inducible protein OsmY
MDRAVIKPLATLALGLVLANALSACSAYQTYKKCGSEGCPGDAQIAAQVEASVRAHPGLEFWSIRVQSLDHVVYLYGIVETDLERNIVESVAVEASGGKKVVNTITTRTRVY